MFIYEKKLQYPVKIKNTNPPSSSPSTAGPTVSWARPCAT